MCGVTDEGEASADEPVGNVLGNGSAEQSAPFETVHADVAPRMLPQVAFLGVEFAECGVRYVGGGEDVVDDVVYDDSACLTPEVVAAGVVPGEADLAGPEAKSRLSTPRGQRCRPAITASSTRPSQMTYPANEASAWPGGDGTAHDTAVVVGADHDVGCKGTAVGRCCPRGEARRPHRPHSCRRLVTSSRGRPWVSWR